MQVINDPNRTIAGGLANALGTGLQSGLQNLAALKMQQLQQRHQKKQLGSTLESLKMPKEVALLPPELQKEYFKQRMQQPQQQAYAQALQSMMGQGDQQATMPGQEIPGQQAAAPAQLTADQAFKLAQLGMQKEKLSMARGKEMREYLAPVAKEVGEIKEKTGALDTMDRLAKTSGALNSPAWMTGLKMFGLDQYPAFTKPGTQEYNAATVGFLTGLRSMFGARPTQWEVGVYMNKLPGLMNSPEGRKTISENMRRGLQAQRIALDAKKDIIRQKRSVPADIELLVDDKVGKKIDQLWGQNKKSLGINTVSEAKPDARSVAGKIIKNLESGEYEYSNGKTFTKATAEQLAKVGIR